MQFYTDFIIYFFNQQFDQIAVTYKFFDVKDLSSLILNSSIWMYLGYITKQQIVCFRHSILIKMKDKE